MTFGYFAYIAIDTFSDKSSNINKCVKCFMYLLKYVNKKHSHSLKADFSLKHLKNSSLHIETEENPLFPSTESELDNADFKPSKVYEYVAPEKRRLERYREPAGDSYHQISASSDMKVAPITKKQTFRWEDPPCGIEEFLCPKTNCGFWAYPSPLSGKKSAK